MVDIILIIALVKGCLIDLVAKIIVLGKAPPQLSLNLIASQVSGEGYSSDATLYYSNAIQRKFI